MIFNINNNSKLIVNNLIKNVARSNKMWYFFSPNIIYGEDALSFLENITGAKCFIITDKMIEKIGYLKILTDKLDSYGKEYKIFNDVVPDPHEEGVLKAREQCINYAPDLIIALGGGSVMDTAKTVWALYEFQDFQLDDIHAFRSDMYDMGKKAKLIAIPTTSGTGAETTYAAVISRFQDNIWKKYMYVHRGLIPTYAIVDPIFPTGMPKELTASTGFDAIAHSIEGIISSWRNDFSDALALKAIELIFNYLPIAYKDGKNLEARDKLHQAATMAGLAFGNGQVHIGHAMGHSWGAIFHTPHGVCVGILLKYVTQFCMNDPSEVGKKSIEINARFAKQLGWAKWEDSDKSAANKLIEKIVALQKQVKLPLSFKELGIPEEEMEKNLDDLVSLVYQDSSGVMAPRSASGEDFKKLYRYAYEGKDIDF